MATCDNCGTTILFGGVRNGNLRFCNEKCHQAGHLLVFAEQLPAETVAEYTALMRRGECPKCGGAGPIDVHTSHTVWSALVFTSYKSKPEVCCRRCGVKSKLSSAALSSVFGWWGFPWGLMITPVQVIRNLVGLFSSPDPTATSPQLENFMRIQLAAHLLASGHTQADDDDEDSEDEGEFDDQEEPH